MSRSSITQTTFVAMIMTIALVLWPHQSRAQMLVGWEEVLPPQVADIDMDMDADGIFDLRERALRTNPRSSDTDSDGFNDLFEYNYREFGFDPRKRTFDRDRDGLPNAFEKRAGTSPTKRDTDGDGFSDFDEVMNRQYGFDPVQMTIDPDWDGIASSLEMTIGSDPENPDTNDDGVNDFQAFQAGLNPKVWVGANNLGEMVGKTHSERMEQALLAMRDGASFPPELARELPYPAVTRRLYGRQRRDSVGMLAAEPGPGLTPSAAAMQQSVAANLAVFDPSNWPAYYPTYNQVVSQLKQVALAFDGSPNPNIVRLFRWSQPTVEQRRIYALKISDNPSLNEEDETELLFTGLHHGKELVTASFTLALIQTLTQQYAAGTPGIHLRINNSETWIIPVVNPDGYSKAVGQWGQGPSVSWRKNCRKVAETDPNGHPQLESSKGVDPNRNYGMEHIRTWTPQERVDLAAFGIKHVLFNGLNDASEFDPPSSTYAGLHSFSDVEALAVSRLADNQFFSGDEIDGLRCSLSWHTGANGVLIHPYNHETAYAVPTPDREEFEDLMEAVSKETGYWKHGDQWMNLEKGYQAIGTSDDWLYRHKDVFAITVEAWSRKDAPDGGNDFFPEGIVRQVRVVNRNVKGAINFLTTCATESLPGPQPVPEPDLP